MPTTKTLPEEYSPDMVYSTRKTTITHSNGTEIPKIHIEDDLRHPNSAKKVPAELPAGATWTGFTDFSVIPVQGTSAAVLSTPSTTTPSTKTSESTDEEMPQSYSSASTSSSELRDEWKIQGEYLIRVHNRPRTALFTPSDIQGSPKLPEELTGHRITRYKWTGTSEVQEAQDDFTGPTAHLELGTPWTGETLFRLQPSQTRGRYDGA